VLLGGRSSEREVSLSSGRQVFYNLDPVRWLGVGLYLSTDGRLWQIPEKLVIQNTCADIDARLETDAQRLPYEALPDRVDIVFVTLHGKYGDDGCIQGALELLDIPYTGSGALACGLSLDKPRAHALMAAYGHDVPREIEIPEAAWRDDPDGCVDRVARAVGYPAVVLPAREGSSVGVTAVSSPEELAAALDDAYLWDRRALVEERLDGMEFSIIVLGNDIPEPMLPTEVITGNPVMTYEDKYMPGRSQKITPARVDAETCERIQRTAAEVYRDFGFRGYARLDGFLTSDDRLVFNDPNSTSGMAPSSFMFHQAAEAGLAPADLVTRILELGLQAHGAKRGPL
jgi:D-alanine--D-alanine ligase